MTGMVELDDYTRVALGQKEYFSLEGTEIDPYDDPRPYFENIQNEYVEATRGDEARLKFKIGGNPNWTIKGQVKRRSNCNKYNKFTIHKGNQNADDIVERRVTIVISDVEDVDKGTWYLKIWYEGGESVTSRKILQIKG